MSEKARKESRWRRVLTGGGLVALAALLLPFAYLTSVALLLSAYVHNFPFPSRALLKSYAVPSNRLVELPAVGVVYSNYCRVCIKLTGADHERTSASGGNRDVTQVK